MQKITAWAQRIARKIRNFNGRKFVFILQLWIPSPFWCDKYKINIDVRCVCELNAADFETKFSLENYNQIEWAKRSDKSTIANYLVHLEEKYAPFGAFKHGKHTIHSLVQAKVVFSFTSVECASHCTSSTHSMCVQHGDINLLMAGAIFIHFFVTKIHTLFN